MEVLNAPLVESVYLVLTRIPDESCRKRFGSLSSLSCDVFRALINSLCLWTLCHELSLTDCFCGARSAGLLAGQVFTVV